jgi:hypothetical protein
MAIAAFCRLEKLISRDRIKRYGRRDVGYKPTTSVSATTLSTEFLARRWVGLKKSEEKQ